MFINHASRIDVRAELSTMFITLVAVEFTAPIKRLSAAFVLTHVSLARGVFLPTLDGKVMSPGAAVDTFEPLQRHTTTSHIFPVT